MLKGHVVPTIEEWINPQLGKSIRQVGDAVLKTPICRTGSSTQVLLLLFYLTLELMV
jgi:hypothetical protein